MKKILVISGSPRPKGNTFKVTKIVETQIKKLADVEFEYFFLKNANLKYCRGCLLCMKKGEEKCPCKDDSIMLRDKMIKADGIIFTSPVYVHTVSALMKNFYDRFAYICHQPRFRGKSSMLITTTELSGGAETLQYMTFPAFTWGFRIAGSIDVVFEAFIKKGKYQNKTLKRISKLTHEFYNALTIPRLKPTFKELMFFNVMKTKVTLHRNMLPQDYNYWEKKGWIDSAFYDQKYRPKLKSLLARLLVKIKVSKIIKKYGFEID